MHRFISVSIGLVVLYLVSQYLGKGTKNYIISFIIGGTVACIIGYFLKI